jgi:ATP-dependent Clp protease protease subunit
MSTPLYHQVSSGAFGKIQDMEERVEEAKRLQKNIEIHTMEKTKIEKKKLKKVLENKIDWFMTAKEALELGVVDVILD